MDQPDPIMNAETPTIDQDKAVASHGREIEYALILQRMINVVQEDPSQMRLAIYEFARARLKTDTGWASEDERHRLATALETAIQGVEKFSVDLGDRDRIRPPGAPAQIGTANPPTPTSTSVATVVPLNPGPEDILLPDRGYSPYQRQPVFEVRRRALLSTLARFGIGMLLLVAVVSSLYYRKQLPLLAERMDYAHLIWSKNATPPASSVASQLASTATDMRTAERPPNNLPFPIPSDYGIYALNEGALNELQLLPERVPDKRIAMSTPVNAPSRTTLTNGKARFILFRRDLAGNAPDRMDVRVVARVVRALTFDAKGKPGYSPVSDAWNIRNISYEFRVRPIAGNPEMLLVQSDKPNFTLGPGRYVLVLKDQGYEFTVAGKVTDVAQCLERTDAANGAFFSECQKP
jgi:hypothetical protein